MIAARDMAFPRLNALSFALLSPVWRSSPSFPSSASRSLTARAAACRPAGRSSAPIADQTGIGMTALATAVIIAGFSSILGAVNIIATIITMRAPGMRWTRMPMTVWGIFGGAILAAIGTSSFAVDLLMILMDRNFGTSFFFAAVGGPTPGTGRWQRLASQNLFWFFGHPEVYLIVLPAFGIVVDVLAVFTRKPFYGYKTGVIGILGVVVLSFLVWAHHEFVSGWAPELRFWYMATTELIPDPPRA